jgi:hypothetical protein
MLNTLDEWQGYISQLAGRRLLSKAIAANTQAFTDQLLDESYDIAHVEQIVLMFVRQMAATGMAIPGGGAFDMADMASLDPKARQFMASPMSEAEVAEIEANPPAEPPDEVDQAAEEADAVDLEENWGDSLV